MTTVTTSVQSPAEQHGVPNGEARSRVGNARRTLLARIECMLCFLKAVAALSGTLR